MTYQEALDFVWGLLNLELNPPTGEPYTLERMVALMARLGDPQARLPVVHVAGTKGKGSTSAMLESVLRAAGHRTALFTSPHLHDPRERLRINGEPIDEATFVTLVEQLQPHIAALPSVTTFEALTAMAFLWFEAQAATCVVLEVGLGGRLDATNLVHPLVSVITPLALEHTAVLGDTLEQIAAEKAGIIKRRVPVVIAEQRPAALDVVRARAAALRAPLTIAPKDWHLHRDASSLDGQQITLALRDGSVRYEALDLALLGAHQADNARLAVAALHALQAQGIDWDETALRAGLAHVIWPARVEVLQRAPLVVADGAHTAESAAALVATLREALPEGWGHSTLVLGISRDKDIATLLPAFAPLAERLILTRSRHPRAADPTLLAAHPALAGLPVRVIPQVADALRQARTEAAPGDIVVATGSLFVAAEARALYLPP